ncbi:hypothetical protein AY599_04110 [Leptolyngbya valderiana BDU 20041]|nr:hypothetical protein AY599_04110 [Leptolyngbya valderiana BDU 20041]
MSPSPPFDKTRDNIAVVLKRFTLKKLSENFLDSGKAEPYIVSVAIDSNSLTVPAIHFNALPFPNVRKGDTVSFDGQGHLIYGPAHPGAFVAYSILFMESDSNLRKLGTVVEDVVRSHASNAGLKATLAAGLSSALAATLVGNLIGVVAGALKHNKDDELFRRSGTLLRDVTPAFDILRTYESGNEYIDCQTAIVPLRVSNHLGTSVRRVTL